MLADHTAVAAIPSPAGYIISSPNSGSAEQTRSRNGVAALASHVPPERPHVSYVNGSVNAVLATLDRVATVGTYVGTVAYGGDGLSLGLKAVAGAMVRGIGTKVFWVQIGGFDTHAAQGTNPNNGAYSGLMSTLSLALTAFYNDLKNQGLLDSTLVCNSRSSAGALARTAAPAPTTAPPRS